MMRYEGKTKSGSMYVRYVLVNDDTVTWDNIIRGCFSSKFDDLIPYFEVYTKVYEEGKQ